MLLAYACLAGAAINLFFAVIVWHSFDRNASPDRQWRADHAVLTGRYVDLFWLLSLIGGLHVIAHLFLIPRL